jgi:hypothetical protein
MTIQKFCQKCGAELEITALAIRHIEDALMRANKAILEDAQETAGQSWTVYFDLEDSGSYVLQDGELFREGPGGTYTPVGRVPK